jgi:hypothetical protein
MDLSRLPLEQRCLFIGISGSPPNQVVGPDGYSSRRTSLEIQGGEFSMPVFSESGSGLIGLEVDLINQPLYGPLRPAVRMAPKHARAYASTGEELVQDPLSLAKIMLPRFVRRKFDDSVGSVVRQRRFVGVQ